MDSAKFTKNYVVNCHDTDLNGTLTPSGCMRYMQDTVNFQMEKFGPSYNELMERGMSFILSRIKIIFRKPVFSHDEIESLTWADTRCRAFSFSRCYEIKKNSETVAEASSVWALVDVASGHFIKVSDFGSPYGYAEPLDIPLKRKLAPAGDMEVKKVGEKTVFYSDVDKNVHMNNTVYADVLWNFVPDFKDRRISSLDIIYESEAPLGETLEVYRGECENGYFFRTVRPCGKVNVEAVIEVERREAAQ